MFNRNISVSRVNDHNVVLATFVEAIGASRSYPEIQDLSAGLATSQKEIVDFIVPSTPSTLEIEAGDRIEDHNEDLFAVREIEQRPFNIVLRSERII